MVGMIVFTRTLLTSKICLNMSMKWPRSWSGKRHHL